MKDTLPTQDLILISSYLDDMLSPELKAKVEVRAEQDPLFRSTLDEMAYARRLLRSLPIKRAPRNFTLSQKYAQEPRRFVFQPAFAFASVVATAVTIVILAGSLFFPGIFAARTAAPASSELAPLAALNATDTARSAKQPGSTQAPPLILWNGVPYGQGATGMGGGGGGAANYPPIGGAEGSGLGIGGGAATPPETLPQPTPEATEQPNLSAQSQPTPNTDTLILGIAPKDEQGQEITPSSSDKSGQSTQAKLPRPLTTANILEIVFGSIAVIAGALALILRRRS